MKLENFPIGLHFFYRGIYRAVDDPSTDSIISWGKNNKSFIIWNAGEFLANILTNCRAMVCDDFKEFYSKLKEYGFVKISGEHRMEFGHKYFVRGRPDLLRKMQAKSHARSRRICFAAKQARERKLANGLDLLRIG
ncbi:hypothetical protein EUTSA_v10027510mg [Eutrema salsugineum]|uniref:HSF-type DNA-binding domain-containing protein n=1 Tax=Eutrema salsugineum TaxID=72664 RepID=V4MIT0_EUTSA|nr:heat stress transcription factor A-4a [Eutrema salsugineum]ESQ55287.1 hypothetical protein EUTSA_v10027510mg [Eutrema salsugineum]